MADFDQILARVTIRNILIDAGHHPVRNRRASCPIHDGRNKTSFAFTDSTFICHSCGAKGGLLDLVEYLYHCTRQEALRHLCRMAGIPFVEKGSEPGPRPRVRPLPCPVNPLIEDDEYQAAKNLLEWLRLYKDALDANLRIIRRNVKEGAMPLEQFYPRDELLLYQLEEMDGEIAYSTYKVNRLKKRINQYDKGSCTHCQG